MDQLVAVVFQTVGKADIGGAVDQNLIAPGAHAVQGADDAAQNAVFIADVLPGQVRNTVSLCLPADDGIVIFRGRVKIGSMSIVGVETKHK